ncbi:MAG TPA: YncE family protein [Thermoanaerobaculia bacterium]|nr:YncE family protein [Thermoanaerobaculia bacterium]
MKNGAIRWCVVVGLGLLAAAVAGAKGKGAVQPAPAATPKPGYGVVREIPVPGDGGWDYLAVDPAARRVYVTHSTKVDVLDADSLQVVGSIDGLAGVHGVALAPELGRGFISNGKTNSVTVFELASLKKVGEIPVTGESPDAILFDPVSARVFVFNHRSGNVTVIDPAAAKVVGTIEVGGTLEFATTDLAGTVFVNVEDRGLLVAIDARTLAVKGKWPLAPCEEPTGMAIDRAHRRLIAACSNGLAAVVDPDHGKVVATVPIGQGVDGAGFDPQSLLAFSSNGEGSLTVVREERPDRFAVVETVPTRKGGRTMAVDEKTHRVFVSTAQYGPAPAPTAEQPHPRPPVLPGTFVVLVLEPAAKKSS